MHLENPFHKANPFPKSTIGLKNLTLPSAPPDHNHSFSVNSSSRIIQNNSASRIKYDPPAFEYPATQTDSGSNYKIAELKLNNPFYKPTPNLYHPPPPPGIPATAYAAATRNNNILSINNISNISSSNNFLSSKRSQSYSNLNERPISNGGAPIQNPFARVSLLNREPVNIVPAVSQYLIDNYTSSNIPPPPPLPLSSGPYEYNSNRNNGYGSTKYPPSNRSSQQESRRNNYQQNYESNSRYQPSQPELTAKYQSNHEQEQELNNNPIQQILAPAAAALAESIKRAEAENGSSTDCIRIQGQEYYRVQMKNPRRF